MFSRSYPLAAWDDGLDHSRSGQKNLAISGIGNGKYFAADCAHSINGELADQQHALTSDPSASLAGMGSTATGGGFAFLNSALRLQVLLVKGCGLEPFLLGLGDTDVAGVKVANPW